ncbi:MAG: hypothetical protein AAFU64_11250, partial [Bacteroidota bacterium]
MKKKKFYQGRWFKITSILFTLIFLTLLAIDIYVRFLLIPVCNQVAPGLGQANKTEIKCPFLAIAKPSTKNLSSFIKDVNKAGMSYQMALGASYQVGIGQNGLWATLFGKAPDIYKLENVHGISHCDRYNRYLSDVKRLLKEREINDQISLQDLVDIKEWIAEQEGVEINSASKQETALLFGYAGGDLETQKVYTEDIIL